MPKSPPIDKIRIAPMLQLGSTRTGLSSNVTQCWPRSICALLAGTLLVRGAGFTYPFLSYHLTDLGFSTSIVGRVMTAFGVGWFIGQLVCGWLTDRVGRRATLVATMTTSAMALSVLAEVRTLPAVVAAAVVAGVVYDAPRPVLSAVIADVFENEAQQSAVSGWRHFTVNLGAAVTGAVGGLLLEWTSVSALVWTNAAACMAFAGIALRYLPANGPRSLSRRERGYQAALQDSRLWLLSIASICSLTCVVAMFSVLPMLMAQNGFTASAYGYAQVANAAAVLTLTPPLTRWLSIRVGQGRSLIGVFAISSLVLGVGMGSVGFANSTLTYSLAVVAAVPGEIGLFIAASHLVARCSPAELRGVYAGIWGATLAAAVIVAPVLASWSLARGGGVLTAATTAGMGLLGAAICLPLSTAMRRAPAM